MTGTREHNASVVCGSDRNILDGAKDRFRNRHRSELATGRQSEDVMVVTNVHARISFRDVIQQVSTVDIVAIVHVVIRVAQRRFHVARHVSFARLQVLNVEIHCRVVSSVSREGKK